MARFLRAWMLGCLVAGSGCALPGLGLHAASVSHVRHVPSTGTQRRWDLTVWADLTFRARTGDPSLPSGTDLPVPDARRRDVAIDADSCSSPALCRWQREATETALAALPQGDSP